MLSTASIHFNHPIHPLSVPFTDFSLRNLVKKGWNKYLQFIISVASIVRAE
jgi:hypothetical protein